MLNIDKQYNITLTRGDTAYIDITDLVDGEGTKYEYNPADVVWFRLKGTTILEKQLFIDLEQEKATLTIYPEDTINLSFGIYKYEMELVTSLGEHFTFIADKNFTVSKELEEHNGN